MRPSAAARTKVNGDSACGRGVAGQIRAVATIQRVITQATQQRVIAIEATQLIGNVIADDAVISITACLAAEWGRSGVRVNAVSPGYTLTEGLQAAIDRGDRNPADLHAQSAMGRMVKPEEVADAIGFLLSPAASAIRGINLPVDCGGWLAQLGKPMAVCHLPETSLV